MDAFTCCDLPDEPIDVEELLSERAATAPSSPSYRQQLKDSAFDSHNYAGSSLNQAGFLAGWIYGSSMPPTAMTMSSQETHRLTDACAIDALASTPQTLESIGKLQIQDTLSGEYVTVESLWREQPVVIGFFRRFGCRLCRWGALQLSRLKPLLDAANVRLIAIGFEAHGLQSFIDGKFFDGDVFVDLTKSCYRGLGLQNLGFVSLTGCRRDAMTGSSYAFSFVVSRHGCPPNRPSRGTIPQNG